MSRTILAKRVILTLLLFITSTVSAFSQIRQRPYSRFGLGTPQQTTFARQAGMGGTGTAFVEPNFFTLQNPASYAWLRSFALETGLNLQFINIKTPTQNLSNTDFNLSYLAIGLPLGDTSHPAGLSFGAAPYTTVNYNLGAIDSLTGYNQKIVGDGGTTRAYLGAARRFGQHLFLGANANFIFGNINRTSFTTIDDSANGYGIREVSATSVGIPALDLGLIYRSADSASDRFSVGASAFVPFKSKANLSGEAYTYDPGSPSFPQDSLYLLTQTKVPLKVPAQLSLGATLTTGGHWLFAADLKYQRWSQFSLGTLDENFNDAWQGSLGIQYTPSTARGSLRGFKNYFSHSQYRGGYRYDHSYLPTSGNPLAWHVGTLGMSLPLPPLQSYRARRGINNFSFVDISVEGGTLTGVPMGGINERYFRIFVGLHLFEQEWFVRRRIE